MKHVRIALLAAAFTLPAFAEDAEEAYRLYQVGSNGRYCISITTNTDGCISGVDQGGNTVNVIDVLKGKKVVFENLSDAPHDMKFSGANAEDLPAQRPNADAVDKVMRAEDTNKQKITCSFHGDMLGLGYRAPTEAQIAIDDSSGHVDRATAQATSLADLANAPGGGRTTTSKMVTTAVADVADFIMRNGAIAEVKALLTGRPELEPSLLKARPDVAFDIMSEKGQNPIPVGPNGQMAQVKGGKMLAEANRIAAEAMGSAYGSDPNKGYLANGTIDEKRMKKVRKMKLGDADVMVYPLDWEDADQGHVATGGGLSEEERMKSGADRFAYPLGKKIVERKLASAEPMQASVTQVLRTWRKPALWGLAAGAFGFWFFAWWHRKKEQAKKRQTQIRRVA